MLTKRLPAALLALLVAFAAATFGSQATTANAAATCINGTQSSGAKYRICMPAKWNQQLVIYAHGFVDPALPVGIPEDQLELPDGTNIADIITNFEFAFATTSYSKNGLAVQEGIDDVLDLVYVFSKRHGTPRHVFLVGASEGGLVTALAVERHPDIFSGGVAACGPIGDFRAQLNYIGDIRVLFDYFFPGVIPGSPIDVPAAVTQNWASVYEPAVRAALAAAPDKVQQILAITHVSTDAANPATRIDSIVGLLWYNVVATLDATAQLGGQPFDNASKQYSGSANDTALNQQVQRFSASPVALQTMSSLYETTGDLAVPLVTLHTTGDPTVPYLHEYAYGAKVFQHGATAYAFNIPISRYGHCNFQPLEVLIAFFGMGFMVWSNE